MISPYSVIIKFLDPATMHVFVQRQKHTLKPKYKWHSHQSGQPTGKYFDMNCTVDKAVTHDYFFITYLLLFCT